jgi:hypothetical protein
MASSEKQVAANRSNAKKSTGPRTPEGKQKASLNAVRHGLTAQTSVLPGEDEGELNRLASSLMKQLKPNGVVQRIIAERIVSLAWKLRRVARAEEAVAREMEEDAVKSWKHERATNYLDNRYTYPPRDCPAPRDGATMLAGSWRGTREHAHDERLLKLTDYELKLDAALRAGMRELLKLQKDAGAFEEVEENEGPAPQNASPSQAAETSDWQNEPNSDPGEDGEAGAEERPVGPSAAPADGGAAPAGETNPTAGENIEVQGQAGPGVTSGPGSDSSAPVPGTSASPPPGPRR